MARTITTIKASITDEFMNSSAMATKYGFTVGDSFDSTFSKVSFESIWFYIIAFVINVFEQIFDTHKAEVTTLISNEKPHTRNWYANMALAYMHGYSLVTDQDYYDTSALTNDEITAAQVVKNASAVELSNVVYIKVKGSSGKLSDAQEAGLKAYFQEIKDAGVKLSVVNKDADQFKGTLDIYYNPMVLDSTGLDSTGTEPVRLSVADFISDLPFNGEFRLDDFLAAIGAIEGVEIPVVKESMISSDAGGSYTAIDGYTTPEAGWMIIANTTDLTINYKVYEPVGD